MDHRRKILSFFKPPTRMTRVLVEELHRCWAKLDGRAATIRRLLALQADATSYKWMAVRMAMRAWRERDDARAERLKLRDAIQRAGCAVCQTSGDWTIHEMSEQANAEERRTDEVIAQNIDLELENKRLQGDHAALRETLAGVRSMHADALEELDRLRGLLKSAPLCQACLGNPMVQSCQPWCQEAEKLRKADRQARQA